MNLGILLAPSATPRPSSSGSVRRIATRIINRVSATVAEFRTSGPGAPVVTTVVEPAEVADVEMPSLEDLEAAAATYFRAADQARAADRAKRAAKKVLDRVPVGVWGYWRIEREPSARQTVDLEAVRATYKRLGLGEVPMKSSAPSLKVTRVQVELHPEVVEAELRTLAGAR